MSTSVLPGASMGYWKTEDALNKKQAVLTECSNTQTFGPKHQFPLNRQQKPYGSLIFCSVQPLASLLPHKGRSPLKKPASLDHCQYLYRATAPEPHRDAPLSFRSHSSHMWKISFSWPAVQVSRQAVYSLEW